MPNVQALINQFSAGPQLDLDTWEGISQIATDGSGGTVGKAFRCGQAEMVTLEAGFTLYKFNNFASLQTDDDLRMGRTISPWWSTYDPWRHDCGWLQRKYIANHLGVSVREWGRVTSVIKENWNSVMWLAVITLQCRVRAAFGGFAPMLRIDPVAPPPPPQKPDPFKFSKVNQGLDLSAPHKLEGRGLTARLPGGATQFYIHNLKAVNVTARFEYLGNS